MRKLEEHEKRNVERLRGALAECAVLLKYNGAFPLDRPGKIVAYGGGVRNTVKGGTGSGEVNSRFFINIEEGLTNAGFWVTTGGWLVAYDQIRREEKEDFLRSIKAKARKDKTNIMVASMGAVMKEPEYELPLVGSGEAAIYVVARISGEGNDRFAEEGDFKLNDSEVRDILALNAKYDKFMLVINAGGPIDLSPVMEVGNILVLSQLGVETGRALADILLGKSYPSGKLATTWARYEDYAPGGFGDIEDTEYNEGIYVGYRYFDAFGKEPLFPFGYGLGYTTFETGFAGARVEGSTISVDVEVSNTGKAPGKEVVQIYLSAPEGKLNKEAKSLAGFAKTGEMLPDECEKITVTFDLKDHASYDAKRAEYILESGDYCVLYGTDSRNVKPACIVELSETVTVRKVRNAFGDPGIREFAPDAGALAEAKGACCDGTLRFVMDPSVIATDEVAYGSKLDVPRVIANLSDEELMYLNVGAFDPRKLSLSIVGNAGSSVAGAAGETTSLLRDRGIPNIVMADGPAGVRIARDYYRDEKGCHAIGGSIPASMMDLIPKAAKVVIDHLPKTPKGVKILHQYATALPIGTAIAQSWNVGFAEMCGDIVGEEMELYGVDLWLAPGMNIHRNVLCGRNSEYFSEDPVITGEMAAALTRGVQAHPGRGVTVKHYAANSQETNRYGNNSKVSERAMREIYLRGFERCISKSDPLALMTSYNLINGTHTSEREDLIKQILIDEFGFSGTVMTDWVIMSEMLTQGKHPVPNAAKVARASHSLFMPGGKRDFKEIKVGLKKGVVTREQLQQNAARLYRVMKRLGKC